MEQTVQALVGILTKAIPTIIILVILHQFLKAVLFGPIEKMLKQRGELTHGARHAAEHSLKNAERKTAEYEAKLRDARAVVYKEQEDTRKQWLRDQGDQIARAKADSAVRVDAAKKEIASEAAAARVNLEQTSSTLADQIATAVLTRRAG
jgi:F-type H+-transporting ATPase subunit b